MFNIENASPTQPFSDFRPFINTENLPQDISPDNFIDIIKKLHETTGQWWGQGNCVNSLKITFFLNGLLKTLNHKELSARTWIFGELKHSWTQISFPKTELIVDPFGFLEDTLPIVQIIPFFGNLDSLKQSDFPVLWKTYHEGRPLTPTAEVELLLTLLKLDTP